MKKTLDINAVKLLKLDTTNDMHKQLDLPDGKYGVVVAVVNVQSMYTPQDQLPLEIYPLLKSGDIEINTMYYSDTTEVSESNDIDIKISVLSCELDSTNLTAIAGVYPAGGLKPYALIAILDEETLHDFKVSKITLVDVDGVMKADVVINPLLPTTDNNVDDIDVSIFKLSFIPYTDFINNNYYIRHDTNSLNSILARYMLLSNRNDISDINIVDSSDVDMDGITSKVVIIIDSDGNVSINGSAYTNMLDVIKNMCSVLNIDFTGTELMLEIDSIIRGEDGYGDIKKILLEAISTDDGKAGFIENTIPLVATGMYKSFTKFFNSELVELNIRKRIAKEILETSAVAHDDFNTYTIINSNILLEELIECIYIRELENPSEDHIYSIITNNTLYTTSINIGVGGADVHQYENIIIETFGNLISDREEWVSQLGSTIYESTNPILQSLFKDYLFSLSVYVHKPTYCTIEQSI